MAKPLNKNSSYVQSLVDFILDTKPYHSKLTETVEEYQFFDSVKVNIDERFLNRAKIDSTWLYNYFSSENPLQRTMPLHRVVNPMFSLDRPKVAIDENTDMAGVPFVYSKKMIDNVGPSAVFIRRADGTAEPLQESVDFFTSHGSYQFQIKQTQNANQFNHIVNGQAGMLALDADVGDTVARADLDKVFQLKALPAELLSNWEELSQALLNPLYTSTMDEGIVAAATAKTRSAALDVTKPQSAVNRIRVLLDQIQVKVSASPNADVQAALDDLYDIIDTPNLPQSYEALLNTLALHPEIDVDEAFYKDALQALSSPLFFYQFSDTNLRESGLVNYADVSNEYMRVFNIKPDYNGSYEEWILTASPGGFWSINGSTSGFVGYISGGESFFSIGKVAFNTQLLADAPPGTEISLIPDHKITIHKNAPLETWNIIKVNAIAHNQAQLVSAGYGNIQDLSGNVGLVTLLDNTIPTTTIILEAQAGGQTFILTSTEDLNHQGVATVNQTYNDGQVGFKILSGTRPYRKGDRFYIEISNEDAVAVDLDLGYGYDLDAYDNDNLVYNNTDSSHPDYQKKIGFWYDGRFTDFNTNSLNLEITESAIADRKWRMRAIPGVPMATLKKNGSGPNYQVDLMDATSGTAPDPSLTALPVYSMAGDANADVDLLLFYATQFSVEYSDNDFATSTYVATVNVGDTFTSAEHGIKFTLAAASKPYIAVSSDDGAGRVEGGDVFAFAIRNPPPVLTQTPIGLISPNVPRLILHSDSFYEAPEAHWTVRFVTDNHYTVTGTRDSTGEVLGPVDCYVKTDGVNVNEGLSFRGLGVHFTIVPGPGIFAGDTFVFESYDDAPSYLVHGSQTGWTAPAKVGKYYWNGKIGFKITAPEWHLYVDGELVAQEAMGFALNRLREDTPSISYLLTKNDAGYMVSRSDIGIQGFVPATGAYSDRYITFTLSAATVPELKLDINAHQYPLFNAQDTIIVRPKIAVRNPQPDDQILVEKPEAGRVSISLSPSSVNIDALKPITIDQRFVDLETNQSIPLSVTSPYSTVLQGFLPTYTTHYDSPTSVAEFRDSATRIQLRSAANGERIGLIRPTTTNIEEPIVFEWDADFYGSYLPLNAEANIITMGTGWNDQVRANINESIKFLIGGGALAENYLFREEVHVGLQAGYTLDIKLDLQNSFGIALSDGPFDGFLSGYDNVEYDNEPGGYDQGQPPDLVSLLSKYAITAEERKDILSLWNAFLQDPNNVPSTEEQWQYYYDKIAADPNPAFITKLGIGYPAAGLGIDIVDRTTESSGVGIVDALIAGATDLPFTHDVRNYDIGPLDSLGNDTAILYSSQLPPIPATVPAGSTYANFQTPLEVKKPARTFEVSFAGITDEDNFQPSFSIWLPGYPAPQVVPQMLLEKVAPGRFRFSIPQVTEAKLLVGQFVIVPPVEPEEPEEPEVDPTLGQLLYTIDGTFESVPDVEYDVLRTGGVVSEGGPVLAGQFYPSFGPPNGWEGMKADHTAVIPFTEAPGNNYFIDEVLLVIEVEGEEVFRSPLYISRVNYLVIVYTTRPDFILADDSVFPLVNPFGTDPNPMLPHVGKATTWKIYAPLGHEYIPDNEPVAPTFQWSPTTSPNMVMGGLAAITGSSSIMGDTGKSGDLHYFEVEVGSGSGSEDLFVGLGTSSADLNNYPGADSESVGFEVKTGNIYKNGVAIGWREPGTPTSRIGVHMAVLEGQRFIFFTVNGDTWAIVFPADVPGGADGMLFPMVGVKDQSSYQVAQIPPTLLYLPPGFVRW